MNNLPAVKQIAAKQNRRWLVWTTLAIVTLIASSSWFSVVAYACIGQGGGC